MNFRTVDNSLVAEVTDTFANMVKRATVCCPNCEHFHSSPIESCKLNNMRPPATVIAFGCELFKNNDLPF